MSTKPRLSAAEAFTEVLEIVVSEHGAGELQVHHEGVTYFYVTTPTGRTFRITVEEGNP